MECSFVWMYWTLQLTPSIFKARILWTQKEERNECTNSIPSITLHVQRPRARTSFLYRNPQYNFKLHFVGITLREEKHFSLVSLFPCTIQYRYHTNAYRGTLWTRSVCNGNDKDILHFFSVPLDSTAFASVALSSFWGGMPSSYMGKTTHLCEARFPKWMENGECLHA